MKTYSINALPDSLYQGKQTENGVRNIYVDCAPWLAIWPELAISVWVISPHATAVYPAAVRMEGQLLIWPITDADTAVAGVGSIEIMGAADGRKKLSVTVPTLVQATTTGATVDPPEPAQPWVDRVIDAAERAEAAAERAEGAGSEIDMAQVEEVVKKYIEDVRVDIETDETLVMERGVLRVNTTFDVAHDNTQPITSAGVYATVGNIEALLKTI